MAKLFLLKYLTKYILSSKLIYNLIGENNGNTHDYRTGGQRGGFFPKT